MRKLETKCSLVVPQTVPQLPSEGTQLGTKNGVITVQQAQPLEAVRENLAERGGLYCSFFRNSLVFCHFVRKTRIFCRFRPSLSSRIRLSSALQSLLWTSKVPKKSNMSNKSGFLFWVYFHCRGLECGKSSANFPGVADRIASLGTLPAPSTLACRATRVQITASSNIQTTWLA